LEDVIAHYANGVAERPTLSADLKRTLDLSPEERAQLAVFVATLSSDDPPRRDAGPDANPRRRERPRGGHDPGAPARPPVHAERGRDRKRAGAHHRER